jgi:hypothetical protein
MNVNANNNYKEKYLKYKKKYLQLQKQYGGSDSYDLKTINTIPVRPVDPVDPEVAKRLIKYLNEKTLVTIQTKHLLWPLFKKEDSAQLKLKYLPESQGGEGDKYLIGTLGMKENDSSNNPVFTFDSKIILRRGLSEIKPAY